MGILNNILSGGKESFTKSQEDLAKNAIKQRNQYLDYLNKQAGERYAKEIPSYIDKTLGGMANLESLSGVKRLGDETNANPAYGLLHYRQIYVDELKRRAKDLGVEIPADLKASELQGANRDNLQRFYTGKLIDAYMKKNPKATVYTAAKMVHNPGSLTYNQEVKNRITKPVIVNPSIKDVLDASPDAVSRVE